MCTSRGRAATEEPVGSFGRFPERREGHTQERWRLRKARDEEREKVTAEEGERSLGEWRVTELREKKHRD